MKKTFLISVFSIILAGAGCASVTKVADQAAEEAVKPITVPIEALGQAKTKLADVQAGLNRQGEAADADNVTVVMVLTEGSLTPAGVTPGKVFGCNDRLAYVKVPRQTDSGDAVADSLTSLLAIKDTNPNGAYNALANSTFLLEKVAVVGGVTEVRLKGEARSGGVCDDPRIKTQIEETVRRLAAKFAIILNGSEANWRCLGDLSGECK
ncbi:hypothetical protein A3C96_02400 [Candidatus Uhrbacteria bacterium RIFCSPHIGHO2_02_FULL_60_10]|uniref:GerMN domain-containing protein n=1 Tax=Candidatus Uhrbacteria bacterium RIFCSPHIGHO2_02_FULL_60_10 TaxID=1802392 RepID=A0A1F7U3S0_9BACT|nr:MAG: hypothetical protein A3C96_02400 [Candidatus Uhrbacteria bacterium RIFCSPHIGHO2_02_FULL_60_10]